MIRFGGDLRGITDVGDAISVLARDFSDPRNLHTMSSKAAEAANQTFNEYMDAAAMSNPERFGHMYDWGEIGMASGRLWRAVLGSTGKATYLTWDYNPSVNEVPVGPEFSGAADDRRRGGHVFRWKAPVIESGQRVRIEPVNGQWLAIPSAEMRPQGRNTSRGGTMWFTKNAVTAPINRMAMGAFTEAWLMHFSTAAVKVVEEVVAREVEYYFRNYLDDVMSKIPLPKATDAYKGRTYMQIASDRGERIGRRQNGQFMNKQERAAQLMALERYREGAIS